jgi:hypothetical protein
VLFVDEAEFEQAPPNVPLGLRKLLRGVHARQDGLLLVLDTARTLEAASA